MGYNTICLKMNKDDYDKIQSLLPDICPDISFTLKVQDENLVKLGLCEVTPCIVRFNMCAEKFYEMLDTLNDIEIDAHNTPNSLESYYSNPAYQKYLKYGCLYNILHNAERI